jgi:nucleoside-diphosphate-sugar epimerase
VLLLTGATGYLGRALCAAFRTRGVTVRVAGRRAPEGWEHDWGFYDLDSPSMPSETLFRDVTCVVHCGGLAHRLATRTDYERANVHATSQLADAAGRMGVPHFLFISSLNTVPNAAQLADGDASLYPEPTDGYAASKWQAEIALGAICQRHEQALTIIRPALIYDKELTANLARLCQLMRWWPATLPAVGSRCLISRPDLVNLIIDRAVRSLPGTTPSTVLAVTDGQQYDAARISAALSAGRCWGMTPAWLCRWGGLASDWRGASEPGATWRALTQHYWSGAQPSIAGWRSKWTLESLCLAESSL